MRTPIRLFFSLLLLLPAISRADEPEIYINTSEGAEDHTLAMILSGSAVGALGFVAGAAIGMSITDDGTEWSGFEGALIGGSIAGGLLLPVGVHGGNKMQGNLLAVEATSIGVAAAGWTMAFTTNNEWVLPATAVAQLLACILVEQGTTPEGGSESKPQTAAEPRIGTLGGSEIHCNLCPTRDGMGLVFSGRF